ncbi:MAG: 2,3-diaminopropionate biosynthesis protein SbnA [Bacteroidota bacterium]
MKNKIKQVFPLIGNTPLVPLNFPGVKLYAKLEMFNLTGSTKDRPALMILEEGIKSGKINEDTVVVESSSGNFARSLAVLCRMLGIKFIAVIDRSTNPHHEALLRALCHKVYKVMERDETGGCLLNRIKKVKELIVEHPNSFWPNQYENSLNARAHYMGTGLEICDGLDRLDYFFAGVSSGGSITGNSMRIKERFPKCKIIAVDAVGSVIFSNFPRTRYLPGIGSSLRPKILESAIIDEVVHVDETESVNACREMLNKYGLFLGGSSGSVFAAIKKYFKTHESEPEQVASFLCADRGGMYIDNVYNDDWLNTLPLAQAETKLN